LLFMGMELYKSFESLFLSHFEKVGIFRCQWFRAQQLGQMCISSLFWI